MRLGLGIYYLLLRATSGILNEDGANDSQGVKQLRHNVERGNRFRGEVTFPYVWHESEPVGVSNKVS